MKIVEKKKIDTQEVMKKVIKILIGFFVISSVFLLWYVLKPIPELKVAKIQEIENKKISKRNYIFLATDSGDYINNKLSEERYASLIDLISQNKEKVRWNILLSSAEVENLARSDNENFILTKIREQVKNRITEVGYSAKSESKYQSDLKYYIRNLEKRMSFKDKVEKAYDFLNCAKDQATGKCRFFSKNEGGVAAIKTNFGEFYNISGIKINSPFSFDFTSYAAKFILKNPKVTINFSEDEIKNKEAAKKLVEILSPANDTSGTLFWMNNQIVITKFDIKNDIGEIDTVDVDLDIKDKLTKIEKRNDRSITYVDFGNSSMYSKVDPIKFAYKNGGSAKILTENRRKLTEKENLNILNIKNFEELVDIVDNKSNFEFTTSSKIFSRANNIDYKNVTKKELDYIARWIIIKWKEKGRIPNWVYDGKNYYSLRDAFYLFYKSFSERKDVNEYSFPMGVIELKDVYGPYNMKYDDVQNKALSRKVVMGNLIDYMRLVDGGYWENGEAKNAIEGLYRRERKEFTAAEMLYAMAVFYTTDLNGMKLEKVNIPKSKTYPETYELLRDGFGCNWKEECIATSWSLKPIKLK